MSARSNTFNDLRKLEICVYLRKLAFIRLKFLKQLFLFKSASSVEVVKPFLRARMLQFAQKSHFYLVTYDHLV